jgi:hypothetical protein
MKRITKAFAIVFLLAATSQAMAQSLGEIARKEKERREKLSNVQPKVITNADAARYRNGAVTTVSLPAEAQSKTDAPKPAGGADANAAPKLGAAKPESDEPTDFQGRTESFWRQTMTDARKKVKDLENQANVIILKLNDLQNRFYAESDGFRQQQIQREIQKSLYEQDKNKEDLAAAKTELLDLEKDARRNGALPGWIEARTP